MVMIKCLDFEKEKEKNKKLKAKVKLIGVFRFSDHVGFINPGSLMDQLPNKGSAL